MGHVGSLEGRLTKVRVGLEFNDLVATFRQTPAYHATMLSEGTSPQDLTPLMQLRYPPGPKKMEKNNGSLSKGQTDVHSETFHF